MRRWRIAAMLVVLTASAVSKEYVAPTKPPLATLTIDNETSGVILPVTFSKPEKCSGMLTLAKGPLVLGKRAQQSRESVTVDIDASREFTLYVESTEGSSDGISSCRIIYTFRPGEGRRYRAVAVADAKSCYLSLEREVTDANGTRSFEKETSARRRELPGFVMSGFGPQCREETPAAAP